MRLKKILPALAALLLCVSFTAYSKPTAVSARNVQGKPVLDVDKSVAYTLWVDEKGLHLRWTTDKKPVLFTGRLDLDRPLRELTRVRETGSGWAKAHGDRIVMFSTTLREGEDGIDVALQGAAKVTVDLKIDGQDPTPAQVFLGNPSTHPGGFPLLVPVR
jgi:hypothetical protein